MVRLSNTETVTFEGTGLTVDEAMQVVGVKYETYKAENPNKGYLSFAPMEYKKDVDGVPTQCFILWVTVTKNDLPD